MIAIFNSRRRRLGEGSSSGVFVQIDVELRRHLHLFKGAKLGVLMAIALHSDEQGWAWPSYRLLSEETGYDLYTIKKALRELCQMELNGHRVLLRFQPKGRGNQFESNRYLIFPTPEEVAQYEGTGVRHLGADAGGGFDRRGVKTTPRPPWCKNYTTNNNHTKRRRRKRSEKTKKKEEDNTRAIAKTLEENGVFPESATRIAALMHRAGLSPEDALAIFLATLQITVQQTVPDEQAIGRAVYRLEQGIWDAGEKARAAIHRARYAVPATSTADGVDSDADGADSSVDSDVDRIWRLALGELQLELTRATFETWLWNSQAIGMDNGTLVVRVATTYARDWLESRLRRVVERVLTRLAGRMVSVRFVVDGVDGAE